MIITNLGQLKQFNKKYGIYLFTLKSDPTKNYGGKAVNLYKRINEHAKAKGKHYIDYYIKEHGGLLENFQIELIHWWDEPPKDPNEIKALEVAIIDHFDCLVQKGGFNICLFHLDRTGIKQTEEAKEKCRKTWKIKYKNGYIHPWKGRYHTLEAREKNRINHLGKKQSPETIEKRFRNMKGKNHPMFNKHHTPESKLKNRLSQLGKKQPLETIQKRSKTIIEKGIFKKEKNPSFGKIGKLSAVFGRKHTIEERLKMSIKQKGENSPRFDHIIYTFQNVFTKETFIGTRYNFYKKFNLQNGAVCNLIHHKIKSTKNWILINNIIDYQI